MAGDVGQLVGVEPEVEGVEHRAEQRDGEVGLEMAVVVPAERGDAVAGADAERLERGGEPAGATQDLAVSGAVERCGRRGGSRTGGSPKSDSARRAMAARVSG